MARLRDIVRTCDLLLRHAGIGDWPGARNGLQLENRGAVASVAAAVDCGEMVIDAAVQAGAGLLVVHHGLFWSDPAPLTGPRYRKIRKAIEGGLAIYSSHLPLDAHPRLGNNILLARALGIARPVPFFEEKGAKIGFKGAVHMPRETAARRVSEAVGGPVRLIPGGPAACRAMGVVTGGAGNEVARAAAAGIDTFVTGEGAHWTWHAAHELGVNVIYAGHYATETFGVKALAAFIGRRWKIPWRFLDFPTGL